MRINRIVIILPLAAALFLQPACSVGRRLVPQSDIDAYEIGEEVFDTKILLASRDSDFKVAVARRLGEALGDEPVYLRFVGIDRLGNEDVGGYDVIILMTSCIAWGLDPATDSFLKKNREYPNTIVLITSGDGGWKPDMEDGEFDAITSASVMGNADRVAEEILEKVRAIIKMET